MTQKTDIEKCLDYVIDLYYDCVGTCPLDQFDWTTDCRGDLCGIGLKNGEEQSRICWKKYFMEKSKEQSNG